MTFPEYCKTQGVELTDQQKEVAAYLLPQIVSYSLIMNNKFFIQRMTGTTTLFNMMEGFLKSGAFK